MQDFSSQTQGLFSDSLTNFKIVLQDVILLTNVKVNRDDGTYKYPKGTDSSWVGSLATTSTQTAIFGSLSEKTEDMLIKKATEYGSNQANKLWANRYSIEISGGKILGKTPGATKSAIDGVEATAKGLGKYGGKAVSGSLSLVAGVGLDMLAGDTAEEAWGKEISTTAITVEGFAAVGLIMGAPVELPIVAVIGIGISINMGNDYLRDKFEVIKNFEDGVGNAVVSGFNNLKDGVSDLFGGILEFGR